MKFKQMKNIFVCTMFVLTLISCGNRQRTLIEINEIEQEYSDTVFHPTVHSIIDNIISFYDSIGYKTDSCILDLNIIKKMGNCYITICKSLSYASWLKYYTIIDHRLIAIYDLVDECNCGLIDTCKLEKFNGVPLSLILDTTLNYSVRREKIKELEKNMVKIEGFSDEAVRYDPVGRIYKIHCMDSLELVFTGHPGNFRFYPR